MAKYVDNAQFYKEICISLEKGELTASAMNSLMLIAEEASLKLYYKNDMDREDCIQFAKLELLKYWKGYKPIYKNAFSYYTQIAKNGYAKGWNTLYPKKYKGTLSMNGDQDSGHSDLPI